MTLAVAFGVVLLTAIAFGAWLRPFNLWRLVTACCHHGLQLCPRALDARARCASSDPSQRRRIRSPASERPVPRGSASASGTIVMQWAGRWGAGVAGDGAEIFVDGAQVMIR